MIKVPPKTMGGILLFKQYNMNQVILPLDMERKLHKVDIAFTIHEMIEGIPDV